MVTFPLRTSTIAQQNRLSKFNIPLGMWNIEPTLIALLRANGYSVKNPCVDIKGIHFHCSLVRTYTSLDTSSGSSNAVIVAPDAWDVIGGTKALSEELGEDFVQRVHGHAPPLSMMELCIERPSCWSRAIDWGFSHPEGEHIVSVRKHYFS